MFSSVLSSFRKQQMSEVVKFGSESKIPRGSISASVIEDIKKTAKPHSSYTTLNIRLNPFAFLTIFLT